MAVAMAMKMKTPSGVHLPAKPSDPTLYTTRLNRNYNGTNNNLDPEKVNTPNPPQTPQCISFWY